MDHNSMSLNDEGFLEKLKEHNSISYSLDFCRIKKIIK